jgi:glucose/arabinose dehydrogenase
VKKTALLSVSVALLLTACGSGEPAGQATAASAAAVKLVGVGKFDQPLYVAAPPSDRRRVMVVEQPGRILVVRDGKRLAKPFLDIRSRVLAGGEQGLLGLAFAPDYAGSGRFYVYYTRRDGRQAVSEFRRSSSDRANPASERQVLVMADPEGNHNGGQLNFGPDRLLYIGTGDGGGAGDRHGAIGNAQDLGSLLGKILRIDPAAGGGRPYTVPASNPFVDQAGARPEVWTYGLRNPWRFSFDRRTGDLTIGDVGQNEVEEIDFTLKDKSAGSNFGWRPFEGDRRFTDEEAPNAVPPVITKDHDRGWCSITGGYVVRDPKLPTLEGRYLYGDFCKGEIWSARLSEGSAAADGRVAGLPRFEQLSSFGQDSRGRIYVVSLAGQVSRLAAR